MYFNLHTGIEEVVKVGKIEIDDAMFYFAPFDVLLEAVSQETEEECKQPADDGTEQFSEMVEKYTKPSFDDEER